MELIADGLLMVAAGVAALYCWVLSRRLRALKDTKTGLGGAIASLARQVEDIQASLDAAKQSTQAEVTRLTDLVVKAEAAATQIEVGLNRSARVARARKAARERLEGEEAKKPPSTSDAAERMGALKALVDGLRA